MSGWLTGHGVSAGIAIARAFRLKEPDLAVARRTPADKEAEVRRFECAVEKSRRDLEKVKEQAARELGEDQAAVFAAHLLVLQDPELMDRVKDNILHQGMSAEFALKEAADTFISALESLDNEYMRERSADVRDVAKRVLGHLLGVQVPDLSVIREEVIIVAEDLTPSNTAQLNRKFVKGIITNGGGFTSHSAIMARSMEIPAVAGTQTSLDRIGDGTLLIIDGQEGIVIMNPEQAVVKKYEKKKAAYEEYQAGLAKFAQLPTVSADGCAVRLVANISAPSDADNVLQNGGEGIGLFRTEFLYMGRRQLPTEDEQFAAYKNVLERMKGKPVVIRTLDIGGDKQLPYLNLPKEANPFLGFRAIRLCLKRPDLFRTQLRALLRASTCGNLKITFPMIAALQELRQAKQLLLEEKENLVKAGIAVADKIEVGMMIEVPSSAVMADVFAKEIDFFSIGTNDLIQYTLAADRMNKQVAYLYEPFHPAVLRLLKTVIDAAHKEGKRAAMCGEMAGMEAAIPVLLGMGLDEFSMNASAVLPARKLISQLSKKEIGQSMDQMLQMETAEQVKQFISKHFPIKLG
ncbi:phosphoenolpyruvate--protein phosphotransferase [Bacillus badius]|uniref:Phosphoenolpyruvate-protein phosphotransferase n=1 Tax=Bacillus badius TaxID=1455 RepID=A0ABR5B097_BACBA|nr:phosphoenolpyruvate--protein phosphotransferase [Bacillus badius]KIL80310.1 Phosphoenolpyruvate-protein phosphotransferase of PTS system [Bacillus badius]MED4716921.1 phosphoenolpyruvate--protein phosphotransferase [Bacillus badius]